MARLDRFSGLFHRSLLPMVILDDERRFVDANDAASKLLGLPREELITLRADDLTPPEDQGRLERIWEELMTQGVHAGSYEVLVADGTRLAIEYSATAKLAPGRHLSIFYPRNADERGAEAQPDASVAAVGTATATASAVITPREREVLGLLAAGCTLQEIGARLFISPETVRTHVSNAREKLGARSRPHAIAIALKRGLIGD
jgi:PAS domain S-box-containing protein